MSIKSWISKAGSKLGNFFGGVGVFLGGLFADGLSRLLGFWEIIPFPVDWRLRRQLKLRVVILRDQNDALVMHSDVQQTFARTQQIYWDEAKVTVHPFAGIGIVTVDEPSPSYALNYEGGSVIGDIASNFGQVGGYFRSQSADKFWSFLYPPITIFVVNRIEKGTTNGIVDTALGVAVPYFANYALVEAAEFLPPPKSPSTTPAHEMGHLCGVIPHSVFLNNLMSVGTNGDKLQQWQLGIVRSSKYVRLTAPWEY